MERVETSVNELKGAVVHIGEVLAAQSEVTSSGFRVAHERIDAVSAEVHAVRNEVHGVREELREELRLSRTAITERLDRLIDATIRERTAGAERLASIEQRLAKLEERVGI